VVRFAGCGAFFLVGVFFGDFRVGVGLDVRARLPLDFEDGLGSGGISGSSDSPSASSRSVESGDAWAARSAADRALLSR
jgi:hypothetical protein